MPTFYLILCQPNRLCMRKKYIIKLKYIKCFCIEIAFQFHNEFKLSFTTMKTLDVFLQDVLLIGSFKLGLVLFSLQNLCLDIISKSRNPYIK